MEGGIEFTKLMIIVFLLAIFFMSSQAQGIGGLEYGAGQNALGLNSTMISNWQLPSGNLYGSQAAMAGNISLIINKSPIQFINNSIDLGQDDSFGFKLSNFSHKLSNLSNLSINLGAVNSSEFYKNLYVPKEMGSNLDKIYSNPMELHYALQTDSNNMNGNLAGNLSLKPANQELDKIDPLNYTNQSEGSIIIVHPGESIQDAIEAATPGDIVEIESGIYNESIQIDKGLTIRGVDIGAGLPIIDAGGMGNVAEISADGVILEKIIFKNSSRSDLSPGAGIRISSSRNCSIEEIVSYGNYYGIYLADSNDNNISNSNISINQFGIRIYYSNDNHFEHNSVSKNVHPLDIVSSTGNLIQASNFKDNLNKIETSIDNKIINNKEIIAKIETEIKEGVERNTGPRTQQSKHSESGGNGEDWTERVVTVGQSRNCNLLANKAAGTVVFNPPGVMTAGVDEWIDARIGLENTTSLVQGLLGKGDVQFRDIAVAMNMTYIVKLESDSGFEISEKRPAVQMLGRDPAIWMWLVKPLDAGNHTLILSVDLQLEKPPYDSRCVNVTYWPVAVRVLEPSLQQKSMDILSSSYKFIAGSIGFLASVFSLILLFRQFRQKKKEGK